VDLHLFLPITLLSAKLAEMILRHLRIPSVVGSIFAGIVLGTTVLGVIPSESDNPEFYNMAHQLARIGLCALLFRVGLETRFKEFLSVWPAATSVAILGMVLPFIFGSTLAVLWGWPLQSALFLGAALTATSIAVTVSVLSEMGVQKSRESILIIGAAILDDVLGLILLSTLVAFISPETTATGEVIITIIQVVTILASGIYLGPHVIHIVTKLAGIRERRGVLLTMAFCYLLLMAYATETMGLDMIIGAYSAGLAFSHHSERKEIEEDLKPVIELLTPLFFVLLGASIDISGLNFFSETGRTLWAFSALLFVAAVVGKLLSPIFVREGEINKFTVASGMLPRGEVGFIFAQIGLTAGIFAPRDFSSIVLVLIATTILGPILLKTSWRKKPSV